MKGIEEGLKRSLFLCGIGSLVLSVVGMALRHGLGLTIIEPLHRVLPLAVAIYAGVIVLGCAAWHQLGLERARTGWTPGLIATAGWATVNAGLALYGVVFTLMGLHAGL